MENYDNCNQMGINNIFMPLHFHKLFSLTINVKVVNFKYDFILFIATPHFNLIWVKCCRTWVYNTGIGSFALVLLYTYLVLFGCLILFVFGTLCTYGMYMIFWQIFDKFLDEFLLTIASFRIEVPSIFFFRKLG